MIAHTPGPYDVGASRAKVPKRINAGSWRDLGKPLSWPWIINWLRRDLRIVEVAVRCVGRLKVNDESSKLSRRGNRDLIVTPREDQFSGDWIDAG